MKRHRTHFLFIGILIAIGLTISSCQSRESPDIPDLTLFLEFSPQVNNQPLILGQDYFFGEQLVTFEKFKMLISNVRLESQAGVDAVCSSDEIILMKNNMITTQMGKIKESDIASMSFKFGLNPVQHMSQDVVPCGNTEMNEDWTPQEGYKVLLMKGTIDGEPYTYILRGSDMSVGIEELPLNVSVDGNITLILTVDIEDIFNGMILEPGMHDEVDFFTLSVRDNIAQGLPFSITQ